MIQHIKKNIIYYLIIIVCIITAISIFIRDNQKEKVTFSTSIYTEVEPSKAYDKLFNDNQVKYLFIGRQNCSASKDFSAYLTIAMAKYGFTAYYLDTDKIDYKDESTNKFLEQLNLDYTLNDTTDKFYTFMGDTPMFVVIKNKKMVYGVIGTIDDDNIKDIVNKYK